jgi:hypothetical protein
MRINGEKFLNVVCAGFAGVDAEHIRRFFRNCGVQLAPSAIQKPVLATKHCRIAVSPRLHKQIYDTVLRYRFHDVDDVFVYPWEAAVAAREQVATEDRKLETAQSWEDVVACVRPMETAATS